MRLPTASTLFRTCSAACSSCTCWCLHPWKSSQVVALTLKAFDKNCNVIARPCSSLTGTLGAVLVFMCKAPTCGHVGTINDRCDLRCDEKQRLQTVKETNPQQVAQSSETKWRALILFRYERWCTAALAAQIRINHSVEVSSSSEAATCMYMRYL